MRLFLSWTGVLLLVFVLLTGCVHSRSANVYTSDQAMQAHSVEHGTAVSVRSVTIEEGGSRAAGTAVGGVTGGILGSTIGSGRGRTLSTLGGALAGAATGSAIQGNRGTRSGLEIEVELDTGRTLVIVQEADLTIVPGDRVRVLTAANGTARVSR